MSNLTARVEWQALSQHYQEIAPLHMREWFKDTQRESAFAVSVGGLTLDYSRNRITQETVRLLVNLAQVTDLKVKISALFNGFPLNSTEKRPALHTALRAGDKQSLLVNGQDIAPLIQDTLIKMARLVDQVHAKNWCGATGKPITDIVNIGIGGSYLGPFMTTQALKDYAVSGMNCHFISSIDESHIHDVLQQIDPEATLFIVSSKSFTTLETLTNARTVYQWMVNRLGETAAKKHFFAVTAVPEKAAQWGILPEQIFPLWDWVGGRYSIWSAIGLPLMLMIGRENFHAFLAGAEAMDQHFRQADWSANMPVLLGLLGLWYRNFFATSVQAIIPYSYRLRALIPYLQQAEMESNGKGVRHNGESVNYATGPIIFGEEGCNGQHAYHQLLHQGQHLIPVDFILIQQEQSNVHQEILLASGYSQAHALMAGKTYQEAHAELLQAGYAEAEAKTLAHHLVVPGNKPCNILLLDKLNPRNLGSLLALYEHKVFVQGAIWDINSFDQWGVELGKQILSGLLKQKGYA